MLSRVINYEGVCSLVSKCKKHDFSSALYRNIEKCYRQNLMRDKIQVHLYLILFLKNMKRFFEFIKIL